jgi:hypothetical protein
LKRGGKHRNSKKKKKTSRSSFLDRFEDAFRAHPPGRSDFPGLEDGGGIFRFLAAQIAGVFAVSDEFFQGEDFIVEFFSQGSRFFHLLLELGNNVGELADFLHESRSFEVCVCRQGVDHSSESLIAVSFALRHDAFFFFSSFSFLFVSPSFSEKTRNGSDPIFSIEKLQQT